MLWYIAIVATATLAVAIALYRRPVESDDAAILEVAAKVNELTQKLGASKDRIVQSTEAVTRIEPGGTP